jgi:hypothetical protein
MSLLAGCFTKDAEFHQVPQSLCHGSRRERELFGRRRDRDDRQAPKVLVNAQN